MTEKNDTQCARIYVVGEQLGINVGEISLNQLVQKPASLLLTRNSFKNQLDKSPTKRRMYRLHIAYACRMSSCKCLLIIFILPVTGGNRIEQRQNGQILS